MTRSILKVQKKSRKLRTLYRSMQVRDIHGEGEKVTTLLSNQSVLCHKYKMCSLIHTIYLLSSKYEALNIADHGTQYYPYS